MDAYPSFNRITYFIEARQCGLVKIGHTSDPDNRFRSLCAQSPDSLILLGLVPVSEAGLHSLFAAFRHHGEWFRLTPAVRAVIQRCIAECAAWWFEKEFGDDPEVGPYDRCRALKTELHAMAAAEAVAS